MPKYQVEINGQNFLVEIDGRLGKHGFFTLRYVEATDSTAAENETVQSVRERPNLRDLVRNASEDPPVMDVTGIDEVDAFDEVENRELGFIWYEENPKRWWQFWKR